MKTYDTYYVIHSWMINDLKLQGLELNLYAIIHGFSQDGVSYCYCSYEHFIELTGCNRSAIQKALLSLQEKKLVIKNNTKILRTDKGEVHARGSQNYCLYYTQKSREYNLETKSNSSLPLGGNDHTTNTDVSLPLGGNEVSAKNEFSLPLGGNDHTTNTDVSLPLGGNNNKFNNNNASMPAKFSNTNNILKKIEALFYSSKCFEAEYLFSMNEKISQYFQTENEKELYLDYVYQLVISKKPKSPTSLFKKLCIQDDIISDYKILNKKTSESEKKEIEKFITCPVCGQTHNRKNGLCLNENCKFDMSNANDPDEIKFAKQLYQLSPEQREIFQDKMKNIISRNLKAFPNRVNSSEYNSELENLYKEFNMIL